MCFNINLLEIQTIFRVAKHLKGANVLIIIYYARFQETAVELLEAVS
jgi:hypothetical protein